MSIKAQQIQSDIRMAIRYVEQAQDELAAVLKATAEKPEDIWDLPEKADTACIPLHEAIAFSERALSRVGEIAEKPAIDYLLEAIKITAEAGMFKEARDLIAQLQKEVGGK